MSQTTFVMKALSMALDKVVKKITLDVTANLIEATPVDTGWARANWIASIGAPVIADLSLIRSREQRAAGVQNAVGEQATGTATVAANYKRGKTYVTNNVPYIVDLNDGTSMQAPSGFVQEAIVKGLAQQ